MDPNRVATLVRFQHQHSDGKWGHFEPRPEHHDPADHDPERAWARGQLYACTTCDEKIRVQLPDGSDASEHG